MRNQNIGRIELLQWLNEFTECDYPKIESCCDGIGYCQVLDAIHPGIVNLSKLNFHAKYPEEYIRNLRILEDSFSKLEIEKVVQADKLSKGKFQDNMRFLQWLYNYANKTGPITMKNYKGYERRMEIVGKQKNNGISPHLIPNNAFLKFKPKKFSQFQSDDLDIKVKSPIMDMPQIPQITINNNNNITNNSLDNIQNLTPVLFNNSKNQIINDEFDEKLGKRLAYLEEYLKDLEGDLKTRMEYNWKLLYAIEDMMYQRNTLFGILKEIEDSTNNESENNEIKENLIKIISHKPNDFKSE